MRFTKGTRKNCLESNRNGLIQNRPSNDQPTISRIHHEQFLTKTKGDPVQIITIWYYMIFKYILLEATALREIKT